MISKLHKKITANAHSKFFKATNQSTKLRPPSWEGTGVGSKVVLCGILMDF